MHIRCGSRIFQKGGSDEKNKVPDVFGNFPYNIFILFRKRWILHPGSTTMVIESKI